MIVLDAGALLALLLRTSAGPLVEQLMAANESTAAHLIDAEVFHRLVTKKGQIDRDDGDTRIQLLAEAPIERVDHRLLLTAGRRFAASVSGYDSRYAGLTFLLGGPLVTTDGRLAATLYNQFGVPATHLPPGQPTVTSS